MISFILEAKKGDLTTIPVGRVPGGFRLQVDYGREVSFRREKTNSVPAFRGTVVEGNDWVLVRDDGVAVFDARLTLQTKEPLAHVFDAMMTGRILLTRFGWTKPIGEVSDLQALDGELNVTLPIVFETSIDASAGLSKAIQRAAKDASHFAALAADQFFATGQITLRQGTVESLHLTVAASSPRKPPLPKIRKAEPETKAENPPPRE
jgi:hypothetical protein